MGTEGAIWFGLTRLISSLFGENFGCPCSDFYPVDQAFLFLMLMMTLHDDDGLHSRSKKAHVRTSMGELSEKCLLEAIVKRCTKSFANHTTEIDVLTPSITTHNVNIEDINDKDDGNSPNNDIVCLAGWGLLPEGSGAACTNMLCVT